MPSPFHTMGFLTLIAALLGRRREPEPGGLTEPMPPSGVLDEPHPFPQATPSGLPPFPSGWVYFQPPPHAVVVRAWQLLKDLWTQGEGAIKQEQTAGQWVTYRAEKMNDSQGRPTVKGVTAWRMRNGVAPSAKAGPSVSTNIPTTDAAIRPRGGPTASAPGPLPTIPASFAQPASVAPLSVTLPPLPASFVQPKAGPAPAVLSPMQIQLALNAAGAMPPLVPDGKLGPKSKQAVHDFQVAHPPLVPDGIPGPLTQTALAPYLRKMA